MNALKKWWNEEPVATRVGPIVALVAGYLVYKGVIDEATEDLVVGVVGLLLGGGALAAARTKVWPEVKLPLMVLDILRGGRDGTLPGSERD